MTSATAAGHPRLTAWNSVPAHDRDRRAVHLVTVAWGLLWLNVLTFSAGLSVLHLPSLAGKGITQAALPAALVIAIAANRKLAIRPNVVLLLVSLLAAETLITGLQVHGISSAYRVLRLALFVIALWLLTPYWGRRDLLLVRCHITALCAVLGTVLLGLLAAPGHALAYGRLSGVIWPIASTRVAHYAAVLAGLTVILWAGGRVRGPLTIAVVAVSGTLLLLTHTRTATIGLAAAALVALVSLVTSSARARRLLAAGGAAALIAAVAFSGQVMSWLERGQQAQQITDLTGRTVVWQQLLSLPRDRFHELLGFGLSNSSFSGLPIDDNWLASYQQQGLAGVAICALIIVFLLVATLLCTRGLPRALALFLVIYCLIASVTEVGFTDASPYLLDIVVTASLLVPAAVA